MFYQFHHFGSSESFSKESGENFSFPIHLHQSLELITVISGEMEVTVDESAYLLKEGEAVLVFPHQLHSLSSNNSEHILCIFSPELVKAYTSKYSSLVPENNKFILNKYLFENLKNIKKTASSFEKKGFLYSVCAEFDKENEYKKRINSHENLLYKIFEFVEKNYKNDCSLYMLANDVAFSYSYLSRYFKKITGISFNEYVNQYRIRNACHILTNSNCSILECAYEVGYNSLRSFNRNFKQYMGVSPNEYRR